MRHGSEVRLGEESVEGVCAGISALRIISQAIAFNLFLAFFPTLLLAAGFGSSWLGSKTDLLEAIRDFVSFLPPGSQGIVSDFLTTHGRDLWKYALLGWAGTLLGGSQ